mmetsp:Transcript_32239/g.69646  ORF Transcript_32239/g.69646 Transcript_32239/m.69646 type:complete len:254 (-) Transcript_32239:758-1519(-)
MPHRKARLLLPRRRRRRLLLGLWGLLESWRGGVGLHRRDHGRSKPHGSQPLAHARWLPHLHVLPHVRPHVLPHVLSHVLSHVHHGLPHWTHVGRLPHGWRHQRLASTHHLIVLLAHSPHVLRRHLAHMPLTHRHRAHLHVLLRHVLSHRKTHVVGVALLHVSTGSWDVERSFSALSVSLLSRTLLPHRHTLRHLVGDGSLQLHQLVGVLLGRTPRSFGTHRHDARPTSPTEWEWASGEAGCSRPDRGRVLGFR